MDEFAEHVVQTRENFTRIQLRLDQHDRQLDVHHQDMKKMNQNLLEVVKKLDRVAWSIGAATAVLVIEQIGFIEFAKRFIL